MIKNFTERNLALQSPLFLLFFLISSSWFSSPENTAVHRRNLSFSADPSHNPLFLSGALDGSNSRNKPPILNIMRTVAKTSRLGNQLVLPKGMGIHISPIIIHHDRNVWGDDVHIFKPERFGNGVAGAVTMKREGGSAGTTFFPFGGGPRFCVGQGLAMVEAKVALAMILQRYKLYLSPSYVHSPVPRISIRPQHGLQVLLERL